MFMTAGELVGETLAPRYPRLEMNNGNSGC